MGADVGPFLLLGALFLLIVLGMPIAFALGISALATAI